MASVTVCDSIAELQACTCITVQPCSSGRTRWTACERTNTVIPTNFSIQTGPSFFARSLGSGYRRLINISRPTQTSTHKIPTAARMVMNCL